MAFPFDPSVYRTASQRRCVLAKRGMVCAQPAAGRPGRAGYTPPRRQRRGRRDSHRRRADGGGADIQRRGRRRLRPDLMGGRLYGLNGSGTRPGAGRRAVPAQVLREHTRAGLVRRDRTRRARRLGRGAPPLRAAALCGAVHQRDKLRRRGLAGGAGRGQALARRGRALPAVHGG